jgi:hypothetical protein
MRGKTVIVRSVLSAAFLASMLCLTTVCLTTCTKDSSLAGPDVTAPSRITDFHSIRSNRTSITFQWTAPGDDEMKGRAAAYDIRYANGPISLTAWASAVQVQGEPPPNLPESTEQFTVLNLTPGQTYHFAIRAADEVPNWSGVSNDAAWATLPSDTIPPGMIGDLRVIGSAEGSLTFAWTAVGDDSSAGSARTYDFRYSLDSADIGRWTTATQATTGTPKAAGEPESLTVVRLRPASLYYFAVKAIDDEGNPGAPSPMLSATTTPAVPPARIDDLALQGVGSGSITVGWTAVGDDSLTGLAHHYDLRYATFAIEDSSWYRATRVIGLPTPGPAGQHETFTLTNLHADSVYVGIRAYDDVNAYGPLSNILFVRPDSIPPARTGDLGLISTWDSAIDLAWTAVGDDGMTGTASVYDLRYADHPIDPENPTDWATASQVGSLPAPSPPGTIERKRVGGLSPGIVYYFALRTRDEVLNWSPVSNVTAAMTGDTTAPRRIGDLSVTMPHDPSQLQISWTAVGDEGEGDFAERASLYDLRYAYEPITEATFGDAVPIPTSNPGYPGAHESVFISDFGIDRYYFAIRARDEVNNWSPLSNVAIGVVPYRLEAENMIDSLNAGGDPILKASCTSASGGYAVDGVDADGEWIEIAFQIWESTCFTDSLRSAADVSFVRTYAVEIFRASDHSLVSGDTLTTLPGAGIS